MAEVVLFGETTDFVNGVPLREVGCGPDGSPELGLDLELPPGVYAYKLKVDGVWTLDPRNPRTRCQHGARNNVLVVGGAPEPLLFAPAAPFVVEEDSGELTVRALLRKGHGDALTVVADEGHGEGRYPMALEVEEDEHLVLLARVPASARSVRLRFERAGAEGGSVAASEAWDYRRAPRAEAAPAWFRDAIVYAIFVDRFRPLEDHAGWTRDPGPDRFAGGHLAGVTRSLDALRALGVSVLYLTPVHVGASCHRYDMIDPLTVDPRLGGEAAFNELLEAAHARGMHVLVDFSFAHVGRGFPAYEDVLARGRSSAFAGWFQWRDDGTLKNYGHRTDAPLLDLAHPDVQALAVLAAERWAKRGVDGLRLDAAAEVPHPLARAVRARFRALRPDAVILGELIPPHAWRWRSEGSIDAATDFGFHAVLNELVAHRTIDAPTAAARLAEGDVVRGVPRSAAVRFASTHDHVRFASAAHMAQAPSRAPLGLFWLLTGPGVPMLLYGEEIGMWSRPIDVTHEGVWTDRAPMPWPAGPSPSPEEGDHAAQVASWIAARRASPALSSGDCALVHAADRALVLRRSAGGDVADIVIHAGDDVLEIDLDDPELPVATLVASVGDVRCHGTTVIVGPNGGAVLRRRPALAHSARAAGARDRNLLARDLAFRSAQPAAPVRPTRIDFAVTERCNLRCQHCITHAPERTRSGTARTLSPYVLDRLRGDLALADYFGFVHGGESLTAPIFFDLLGAIKGARGAAKTTVHLLTNGAKLTERTAADLVERGVTSLSVSLDGATAAVNDRVREGGSFDAIVAQLRGVARARRIHAWDLRLGISFVILRSNVDQLLPFVDLAADLGVDWIKLEEPVGVTAFAEGELVTLETPSMRGAVAQALVHARARGLVAVDHTRPMPPWRCQHQGDDDERARADEFANRAEIHPCRSLWELACVEPNGDVRLGEFYGTILGNVVQTPLAELWRGAMAERERIQAMLQRPCGRGPLICQAEGGEVGKAVLSRP